MKNIVIEFNNVTFSYEKERVLQNLSFKIYENEMVTIVGPNGGGKTTLLKLISGLLTPDFGDIDLSTSNIGYVSQHSDLDNKFPISVFETVLLGRVKKIGLITKEDKEKALEALKDVGLEKIKNKPFNSLSGGQKQRVLIARALATEAKILLLDEPTSNIDIEIGKNLNSLLKKLKEKMTIILITHDTSFVSNITDRVFCINKHFKEHPLDVNIDNLIKSSYENEVALVRHDVNLKETGGENELY
ncbi:MAG: Zinc transporter, ATP-binding protein ZnuC [Fusobacteriales bacterium]|jgi:zinc transport system ATP-binding protein|nr:Zinc transporter, ATP-binding protein ZnuC [Fusobacteriales bacterium]